MGANGLFVLEKSRWLMGGAMSRVLFKTLSAKILCFSMIVGLVPLFVSGIILNGLFEQSRYQDVQNRLLSHSQEISLEIESFINTKRIELESMALMPTFQNSFIEFNDYFYSEGSYGSGYQDIEDKYIDFIAKITERNDFNDVFLVSNKGDVIFTLLYGKYHGKNLFDFEESNDFRILFNKTLKNIEGGVSISSDENRNIYFSAPMYKSGKYIATLFAASSLNGIYKTLERSGLLEDYSHITMSERKKSEWFPILFNDKSEYLANDEASELWEDRGSNYIPDKRVLTVSSIIPSISSIIKLEYSESYILTPILRTRWVVLMFVLSMAMIIALASSNISRGITRPIKKLKKSFIALAKGEKNVLVKTDGKDEIASLLVNFNAMVKKLRKTETKLVETEKLVSIGNLAAGVAHEINNPMAIVTSNVSSLKEYTNELVEHLVQVDRILIENELYANNESISLNQSDVESLSSEMNLIIDETGQSLTRVKDIVSSMRVFSEVDKEDNESINVNELLAEIIEESKEISDINIEKKFVKSISITGRKKQLKMAFTRLIDNAIKACDKENKVIQVHIGSGNASAIVCVDDNGCGVEQKDRDKIFDPFFTTREVGKGIGLGLAIAYSIISSHNGSISLKSVVKKGSRFKVVLPINK